MSKVLIFSNSGPGKSTLSKNMPKFQCLGYLNLDSHAWEATIPPKRKSLNTFEKENYNNYNGKERMLNSKVKCV